MSYYKSVSSKGQIDPIKLIVLFILIGVVAAVLIFGFSNLFGKQIGLVDDQMDSLDDSDNDGKPDFIRSLIDDDSESDSQESTENNDG